MALVINDRVRETTSTAGSGTQTLGGAVDGFQTFAAGIGNDNTTYYAISLNSASEWEVGRGTLNGDSSTLARTEILQSSNSDNAVVFSAGAKEIFCTLPSEKALYLDASGDLANSGIVVNASVDASAAIAATKIADGSVSDVEFQRLDGVSSDIQTQLDLKASLADATALAVALG